ncbi:hypothetical protein VN23_06215 [Janthinobacterium sp. B9-8]|nr:hypothetical protein VN23_06215 [Janthinobacterium sp. B9-8]
MSNNCELVEVGKTCTVKVWAATVAKPPAEFGTGNSFSVNFTRLKEDPCSNKAGQSAGELLVPLPYSSVDGNGKPIITSVDSLSSFFRSRASSCDGTCELIMSGSFGNGDKLFAIAGDKASAYALLKMQYSGEQCTLSDDKKPPKPPAGDKPPAPNKAPKFPGDCPANSTFGQVSGVNVCAKNPPKPTDPDPPPKPTDKDQCVSNCDEWDPNKDTKPTGPKPTDPKPGPGGTTPPKKGPHSGDASKPASENASGPGDSSLAASCTDFKCKNKDPATCEIARLSWNNKCNEEKAVEDLIKSDLYKNGNSAMTSEGLDSMKKDLNFGENGTVDMAGVIKRDTFLNKGGLSDVSFTVMGKGFSLPFSSMNKYLSMMGKIAVAFSLLAAARILSSAV